MIGPGGKRGGIASVINTYKDHFSGISFISSYPEDPSDSMIMHFLTCIWKMHKTLLERKEIKIVHLHVASNGSFVRKSILLSLAKIHGRFVVFHMHGGAFQQYYGRSDIRKYSIKKIMKASDAIIALSSEWNDFFKNILQLNNVWTIGNPVKIIQSNAKCRSHTHIELLFLGKICEEKGIFELIRKLNTNQHYLRGNIKLTIAGFGEIERLEREIKNGFIPENIKYVGWIEGEEKNRTICDADIFILPSYYEGLPVSIIECMMCKKPIIATNVGGIPTLVENGYNGWLYEPGDMDAIDHILNMVVENKNLVQRYGENSYVRASEFSPEKIEQQLCELYNSIDA